MKIDILTLFPEMFDIFNHSILSRAKEKDLIEINTENIRDFSSNKHRKTDDYPYGGGAGMVMTVQPVADCINHVKKNNTGSVIYLGPRGKKFSHEIAKELASQSELIFLCGHYEGIDERIRKYVDYEISLGDFILTGGEMACIPIIDSICRLVPGVLGSEESYIDESFSNGLLEYPHYTRPYDFQGDKVPDVLVSGHHAKIEKWRRLKSLELTKTYREDLYKNYELTKYDKKIMKSEKKLDR